MSFTTALQLPHHQPDEERTHAPNIEVQLNIMKAHKHASYMNFHALMFYYQNFHALIFFPIGATHYAYFIHTELIIPIILDEKNKRGNLCYVTFL
jgi:hypothetical protein